MTEIMREPRHLRLIRVADEERGPSSQQRHRYDCRVGGNGAERIDDIGEAAHARRSRGLLPKARAIGRAPQPQGQRQIDERVRKDAMRRAQRKQQRGTDCRAQQQAQVTSARREPHGALQLVRAHDVVDERLRRRIPQHARDAVYYQQGHRMPHLQCVRHEEDAPRHRHEHEQRHTKLNDPPRIQTIGEGTHVHRKEQERKPMRNHRKSAQGRRTELLEDDPVADDVLDAVGQHRCG